MYCMNNNLEEIVKLKFKKIVTQDKDSWILVYLSATYNTKQTSFKALRQNTKDKAAFTNLGWGKQNFNDPGFSAILKKVLGKIF